MIAFKWLARGSVGPFTGARWPRGGWVSAPAGGAQGSGVHACRIAHLPWWIDAELWRVELDGAIVERETQLEARSARLLNQVTAWNADAFAQACTGRAAAFSARSATSHELAEYAAEARHGGAAASAYVAAVASVAARGTHTAFAEERAWQADWLARALDLREG